MNYVIAFLCLVCSFLAHAENFPVTITDVAGRNVTFDAPPQHIALATGRDFPLLEILYQQQAAAHLVAWRNDMKLDAPSMYAQYIKQYPRLATVPFIGKISAGAFDAERFIEMKPKPNLLIMDLADEQVAKQEGLLKTLLAAGIKVITVDFNENPLKNTATSILTVAKALGRETQGHAFVDYYQQHIAHILSVIDHLPKNQWHQKVFIERAAGYNGSCCRTFGNGNMGEYLSFLKADNMALLPLHGAFTGQLSPETVIVGQPDVYIMQTAGWVNKHGQVLNGIPLGYQPSSQAIKTATEQLMTRPWLQALSAYQDHRVYSIYMPFYNSPYNLVAIEFFAKWLYPQAFKDLNPNQTFAEMNQRFGHHPISGVFGINNFKAMQ